LSHETVSDCIILSENGKPKMHLFRDPEWKVSQPKFEPPLFADPCTGHISYVTRFAKETVTEH